MTTPVEHGTPPAETQRLRRKDLLLHGAMAFPLSFGGLPIYLHAPDFYAAALGVPLASLGAVLLVLRVIDAVQDPLIGHLADNAPKARTALIAGGAGLLGGGMLLLFNPTQQNPLLSFACAVFLCTTGFSILSILLQSLGGLWQTASSQRVRVTTWREALGLLGLLTAAVSPALLGSASDPARAFMMFALFYCPVLAAATFLLLIWIKRVSLSLPHAQPGSRPTPWLALIRHPWRLRFFAIYALNSLASAIPAVLVLFFIRDRLQAPEAAGLFLLIYFLSGAAAMPLWQSLSRQFGKVPAWGGSMALAVATFVWASFIGSGDLAAYAVICALSGLALGADLAIPPAILADHLQTGEAQRQDAARLFSLTTLTTKGALALATGLALPLLGAAGYQPGMPVSPSLAPLLNIAYAAVPCGLKLTCLVLLVRQRKRW